MDQGRWQEQNGVLLGESFDDTERFERQSELSGLLLEHLLYFIPRCFIDADDVIRALANGTKQSARATIHDECRVHEHISVGQVSHRIARIEFCLRFQMS
jgi:hypothetical protein